MKREVLILSVPMTLALAAQLRAQNTEAIDSTMKAIEQRYDSLLYPASKQVRFRAGGYGLTVETGILVARRLCTASSPNELRENDLDRAPFGFPIGASAYYFISDRLMGDIGLSYARLTQLSVLGPPRFKTRWSIIEYRVHLTYMESLSSRTSVYWKAGFKMARLSGTYEDTYPEPGPVLRTETAFAPGWEVAIGMLGISSERVTAFGEFGFGFGYLSTRGKKVMINGQTAAWTYPDNAELYRLRLGLMISIGGTKHSPEGIN